jgi:hypothetical protein
LHLPLDYTPTHALCLDLISEHQTKNKLIQLFNDAILYGQSFDVEVQVLLNSMEKQWLRIIAQPERINDKTINISEQQKRMS